MLFDRNIEPNCEYCRYSSELGNNEFACSRRGIMEGSGSCASFRYEPTKRVPESAQGLKSSGVTGEDFTL